MNRRGFFARLTVLVTAAVVAREVLPEETFQWGGSPTALMDDPAWVPSFKNLPETKTRHRVYYINSQFTANKDFEFAMNDPLCTKIVVRDGVVIQLERTLTIGPNTPEIITTDWSLTHNHGWITLEGHTGGKSRQYI